MAAGRVTLNPAAIHALLSSTGPVAEKLLVAARRVEGIAKRNAPRDKGVTAASIETIVSTEPGKIIVSVGVFSQNRRLPSPGQKSQPATVAEVALYQHEGTGIYGPKGRPIRPTQSQFLRFPSKGTFGPATGKGKKAAGAGAIIFTRQVRGVPPHPFLYLALKDVFPQARRTPPTR